MRCEQFGGSWLPIFTAAAARQGAEDFWFVGAAASDVFCVVTTPQQPHPSVNPLPVLARYPVQVPVAVPDGGGAQLLESAYIAKITQVRWHTWLRQQALTF